ncbi:MAG: hypothetical protein JW850_19130 [Thermoflexales bacterium]|nr:hypothetical protein [Thermoflexales bacterium]
MATILIEGQQFEWADEFCRDDESLKKSLAVFYPGVSETEIKREIGPSGQPLIRVVKRALPKGCVADIAAVLVQSPRTVNPAIEMYQRIIREELSLEALAAMADQVQEAIASGEEMARQVKAVRDRLARSAPTPSALVPPGF